MKRLVRKWWFWLIVVLVIGGIGNPVKKQQNEQHAAPARETIEIRNIPVVDRNDDSGGKVSSGDFAHITTGMTLAKVEEEVGAKGELISASGEKGTEAYFEMYKFIGHGGVGANAVVSFQGGKVIEKAQYGIK